MFSIRIVEIHIAVKNALWRFYVAVNNKTHVIMLIARNVCQMLAKFGFLQHIFINVSNNNIAKNLSHRRSRAYIGEQMKTWMGGRTNTTIEICALCEYENNN